MKVFFISLIIIFILLISNKEGFRLNLLLNKGPAEWVWHHQLNGEFSTPCGSQHQQSLNGIRDPADTRSSPCSAAYHKTIHWIGEPTYVKVHTKTNPIPAKWTIPPTTINLNGDFMIEVVVSINKRGAGYIIYNDMLTIEILGRAGGHKLSIIAEDTQKVASLGPLRRGKKTTIKYSFSGGTGTLTLAECGRRGGEEVCAHKKTAQITNVKQKKQSSSDIYVGYKTGSLNDFHKVGIIHSIKIAKF
jgi:hypothetical protein